MSFLKKCVICDEEITAANDSEEHLIPNAIGGRKKVKGVICKRCNNEAGDDWDADLAQQLNPLSLVFKISRDRKGVPAQTFDTASGNRLTMHADGSYSPEKPVFQKEETDAGINYSIVARSTKEARGMLKGVAKKHPELDVDKLLEDAGVTSQYSKDPLKFSLSVGGPLAGRSIVKSAYCLAALNGVPPDVCNLARNYLRCPDGEPCYGFYYERDLVDNRAHGIPLHCVAVQGISERNLVVGYVEFFGIYKMVVFLSDNYCGDDFFDAYAVDPTSGEEMDVCLSLDFDREDILPVYEYEKWDQAEVMSCIDAVMRPAMQRSFDDERSRVVDEATKYAFDNCGAKEGEMLQPHHVEAFSGLMMEKLEDFIIHNMPDQGSSGEEDS